MTREIPIAQVAGTVHRVARVATLLALAAVVLPPPAAAQVCRGDAVPGGATLAGDRFGMIAAQCATLATPATVHRAAQLELYERPAASTAVPMSAPRVAVAPLSSLPVAATPASPPARSPARSPAQSASSAGDAPRVAALAPTVTQVALDHGIDPLLLHAVAHVESRHDPRAVSPAGARGMMQVMPATARRFGVGDPERGLHDPRTNLQASARYLQALRARYGDDLRLILAAYNAGEGAVDRYGTVPPFAETQAYVRDVMAVHRRLADAFVVLADGRLVARASRP